MATGDLVTPALRHSSSVELALFCGDTRIVTSMFGQLFVRNLAQTKRSSEDLLHAAEVLTGGYRIDNTDTLSPISSNDLTTALRSLEREYPTEFGCAASQTPTQSERLLLLGDMGQFAVEPDDGRFTSHDLLRRAQREERVMASTTKPFLSVSVSWSDWAKRHRPRSRISRAGTFIFAKNSITSAYHFSKKRVRRAALRWREP